MRFKSYCVWVDDSLACQCTNLEFGSEEDGDLLDDLKQRQINDLQFTKYDWLLC